MDSFKKLVASKEKGKKTENQKSPEKERASTKQYLTMNQQHYPNLQDLQREINQAKINLIHQYSKHKQLLQEKK